MISSSRFRVDAEKILCYPLGLVLWGTFRIYPGTRNYWICCFEVLDSCNALIMCFNNTIANIIKNDIINEAETVPTCNREIGKEFSMTNIREKQKGRYVNLSETEKAFERGSMRR